MKLWIISQGENNDYDTYDSAVVAAETREEAKNIYPGRGDWYRGNWASSPAGVIAECIGDALDGTPTGVILASFNAG